LAWRNRAGSSKDNCKRETNRRQFSVVFSGDQPYEYEISFKLLGDYVCISIIEGDVSPCWWRQISVETYHAVHILHGR
jgi:hypothetical protein